MAEYSIQVSRKVEKEIEKLAVRVVKALGNAIDKLALDPRPNGSKKLKGSEELWRLRVGDYRIV